jgi:16S rRNA processing protein RimM
MAALLVARIGKPHGLRGEVTVQVHTDDPDRRLVPGAVFATEASPGSGVPRELTVATSRLHRSIWLVGFEEVPDRTGAEGLRGTSLLIDETSEDWAPGSAGEDAWYERDLVGLTAFDLAGERLGEVTGLRNGPQDQLVLRLADGHEALVPFVHAIVPTVDVEGGRVVVDAPPGLLDLGRDTEG